MKWRNVYENGSCCSTIIYIILVQRVTLPVDCRHNAKRFEKLKRYLNFVDNMYHIVLKTHRWYIKIFWHCINICKVNAWVLYRCHCNQQGIPKKNQESQLKFALEPVDLLNAVNKAVPCWRAWQVTKEKECGGTTPCWGESLSHQVLITQLEQTNLVTGQCIRTKDDAESENLVFP
jgi:hypothetical protein